MQHQQQSFDLIVSQMPNGTEECPDQITSDQHEVVGILLGLGQCNIATMLPSLRDFSRKDNVCLWGLSTTLD